MTTRYRLLLVVGARPNFVKIAPILHELRRWRDVFAWRLIHTGQHYDAMMSDVFFGQLGLPEPDSDLGVGSGSHAQQTAAIMVAFERVLIQWRTDLVVVVGDVNSTMACALVAAKLGIRVAHVEAGLRSFDCTMPEEINRVVTDRVSDILFATEESAVDNLAREGVPPGQIHFVGNVMIDTLLAHREDVRAMNVPHLYDLEPGRYGLLTLHRPGNVDDGDTFERIVEAVAEIARDMPVVFPVHPRTRPALARSPRAAPLVREGRLRPLDPLGYLEFLGLVADSRVVLTDSGGVQEETTVLGVPCLTLRDTTERPATITSGTNRLVGTATARIVAGWEDVKHAARPPMIPALWDGGAARRIVEVLRHEALGTSPRVRPGDSAAGVPVHAGAPL